MCVLELIKGRDCYGYELIEQISEQIEISEGTVYPILRRLTKEGCFETYLLESSEGPPRKYYKITEVGRKKSESFVKEWGDFVKKVKKIIEVKKE